MLIVFGGQLMLHTTIQKNITYRWLLGWVGRSIKFIFFIPVILMVWSSNFFICHQIEVLYQFWIHTEYIRKLPAPIEYILWHHLITECIIQEIKNTWIRRINIYCLGQIIWNFSSRGRKNPLWHYDSYKFL
jgi:hypothetical protein